jgi:hypothetical protein
MNTWQLNLTKVGTYFIYPKKCCTVYFWCFLVHKKKMNVHIDSNSESDEETSNTPPDITDDNRNNCPVTINYVNKYIIVLPMVNF